MKKFLRLCGKHWRGLVLVFIIVYVVIGAMIPFARQKTVGEEENVYSRQDFYAREGSVSADRAHVVEDNKEALELRLLMLNEAKERIILSTFDFRQDESTWDLAAAIYQAAERGVQIEIMVDGFSGLLRMEGSPFFYALSSHPCIEVRIYNPINLLTPWKLNGRMHDKYVICDDKAMLLGGRNTFSYFLGDYETDSRSHDREVLIYNTDYEKGTESSVISQVEEYFYSIWDGPYMKVFHDSESLVKRRSVKLKIQALKKRYEELEEHYPACFEAYSYEQHTVPIQKATLISGETGIYGKKPIVWDTLQKLMADGSESVVFHTPYVVMDETMAEGMKEISERVPDFSMVINAIENGDNVVASSDYMLHKKEVLDTGVKLYEFDGGESTHGKTILIDDDMSVIGSYNLDMRSTYMDTELMLAIQGEEFFQELSGYTDEFQKKCRIIVDEDHYELPEGLVPQSLSLKKKIIYSLVGPLIQPVRYVA